MFGFPTTLQGWVYYMVTVGVPILIILATYPRIYAVADGIYDGRNGG